MKTNNALNVLFSLAKSDGAVTKNASAKSNIYQEKFFEGADESQEKAIRRKLRSLSLSYISLLAGAKDKKDFQTNFTKFSKFFAETYTTKKVDFSVFNGLRKERDIKLVAKAQENLKKFSK